jgi:hypothetical protein
MPLTPNFHANRAGVNQEGRWRSATRRGMTVSANGATTTRTTGATAIGTYNIPAANDDDDDFKPSPLLICAFHLPLLVMMQKLPVACLHPLRSLSLFLYGTNTGITSVVDDVTMSMILNLNL